MGIVHQDTRNGRSMDMGTVKRIEIGAARDTDHVEKLTADDSVVVQYVVSLLEDPKVRFRETAGGWNEVGESLPSLDPFGGNGSYSSYGILLLRAALGRGQNRHAQSGVLKTS